MCICLVLVLYGVASCRACMTAIQKERILRAAAEGRSRERGGHWCSTRKTGQEKEFASDQALEVSRSRETFLNLIVILVDKGEVHSGTRDSSWRDRRLKTGVDR